MGHKSLLLAAHYVTALLVYRLKVGVCVCDNDHHHHGPNPNKGGGGVEEGGGRGWRLEGIGWRGHVQGGVGETSVIT